MLGVGMPKTFLLAGVCCGVFLGCSDAAAPRPTPARPANVMIAGFVPSVEESPFMIKVTNDGGPGSFYLRFRYGPVASGDVPAIGETEVLNISAGSELARSYDVLDGGEPDVVSVFTRIAGGKAFLQTDCVPVRAGFTCNGLWDD